MTNSHFPDVDDDAADVRTALAALVAHEPDLPSGTADIERRGRRRLAQRRILGTVGATLVVVAAGVGALSLVGGPAEPTPVAQPPDTTTPVDLPSDDPAGGSQLAVGFPVGSAVEAVASALPAGVSLSELPMDIGWREGGLLDIPIALGPVTGTPPAPTHLVTIQVRDGVCSAAVEPAGALSDATLSAIADAVCAEWVALGSPPVTPADPSGEQRPDVAAQ